MLGKKSSVKVLALALKENNVSLTIYIKFDMHFQKKAKIYASYF